MIRHRPGGSGHPYRFDPDQRVPVLPVAGERLELGATTSGDLRDVWVELVREGGAERRRAQRVTAGGTTAGGAAGNEGHLGAAAAGLGKGRRDAWTLAIDAPPVGIELCYRFIQVERSGRERSTRWFRARSASWGDTGGRLRTDTAGGDLISDRLLPDTVSWLSTGQGAARVRFALRLEPGERVVGFGERFDRLDQRGQRLDTVVFEQYKGQGNRTYLPVPFAIVAAPGRESGWAFHVDTTRRVWFDVGASETDRIWVEAGVDAEAPEPELSLRLFAGSPREVLDAFLDRVGRPTLPPDWVFGPWMSGNEWNTQERVMREVRRSQELGIPVGSLVIEAWSDETTFVAFRDARYEPHADGAPHALSDFTFPSDGAWPDPKGMVDELHALGVKLLLWQIPLQKARPAPVGQARFDRSTMVERGYAVREADGRPYRNRGWWFPLSLMPDFTHPEAAAWWLAKRRYLLDEVGVDGFKTDGGEHAWGDDLRYADGTRGDESNSRYPVLYAAAYHALMREAGREPVTFSRAGTTGAGSYPCHWAGDEDSTWEAFRASLVAGLTAGASGVLFWGWDLAGFSGEIPTAELYLRSAAMAALCPIMQYHSEFNHHRQPSRDRTPWNIAERTGDERVIPVYRRFAELRERLVPYLVAQGRRSVEAGMPLMRPLVFDFAGDARIWDVPYQYLLGDALLVAPVMEPARTEWPVYLPPGEWIDAWTGEAHAGGQELTRGAPWDEIPAYIRRGRQWEEALGAVFRPTG